MSGATGLLRCAFVIGVQASIIEGNLDINIDGISDGDAEGNDETGADDKDGGDELLDERTMELIKLHFFADRYSVNSPQLDVEDGLVTHGIDAKRGPSFHVLQFLYVTLAGRL